MGTFLLFILVIFLVIFALGVFFLRGVVQLFTRRPVSGDYRSNNQGYQNPNSRTTQNSAAEHRKVFSKDEGEYIDYEEVRKE